MMKEHEVLLLKTGKDYLKILSTSGTLSMLKLSFSLMDDFLAFPWDQI